MHISLKNSYNLTAQHSTVITDKFFSRFNIFNRLLVGFLLSALIGLTASCGGGGGGDGGGGGGGDNALFSISNEHIGFHSWQADITNNTGIASDDVVFVISTLAHPKDITSIDNSAKITRKFDTSDLKVRNIAIQWTDDFEAKYLHVDDDISKDKRKTGIKITSEADYTTHKITWLLRPDTDYYLHIYYENGANTFTRSFHTLAYPDSVAKADALFSGNSNTGNIFNVESKPSVVKQDSNNPLIFDSVLYNVARSTYFKVNSVNKGGCFASFACSSGSGLLVIFSDNALLEGHTDAGTFQIRDMLIVLPTRKTLNSIMTSTYGGLTSQKINYQVVTKDNDNVCLLYTEDLDSKGALTNMINLAINSNALVDLNYINVRSIDDMSEIFKDKTNFNGNISCWHTIGAHKMDNMFNGATAFNGDISGWDTNFVTTMDNMFNGASAFNQDLSGWDVSKVTSHTGFATGAGFATDTAKHPKWCDYPTPSFRHANCPP